MTSGNLDIETRTEPLSELRRHAEVASVFESNTIFDIARNSQVLELVERCLNRPYRKDYDSVEDPMKWPLRFDLSNWTLIGAYVDNERLGGAIGAFNINPKPFPAFASSLAACLHWAACRRGECSPTTFTVLRNRLA